MVKQVVVLCLDAFRYDLISKELTPTLFKLKENNIFYENCKSGNSTTIKSMPVLLCGEDKYLPVLSIPARLKKHGIKSYMFSANALVDVEFNKKWTSYFSFSSQQTGKDKDFDKRKLIRRVLPPTKLPRYAQRLLKRIYRVFSDPKNYLVYKRANEILGATRVLLLKEEPIFVWVHLMETHQPYFPIDEILEKANVNHLIYINDLQIDAARGWIKLNDTPSALKINIQLQRMYKKEAEYLDKQIGLFLRGIDTKKTSVIITADHGEEFGEHGQWGHREDKFVDELVHVPLIIVNGQGKEVKEDFSHYDFPDLVMKEIGVQD